MNDEIKVYVLNKSRKYLYLRYIDPTTGKHVEKSAKTNKQKAALEAAGKWQAELREGRYQKPSRMTWQSFRDYYSANALPAVAATSAVTYEATLNVFERMCNPLKLGDVTTARVTGFATKLRDNGAAEATIARHLRQLKNAMRWAHRQGLLNVLPKFDMPKRVKGAKIMRGRPITTEEFERMLAMVPRVIEARPNTTGIDAVTPWRFYLHGLWNGGLRLSESLSLRWDDAPGCIVIDYSHQHPMFRIPAEAEKGNQDRLLPMTPEFSTLLDGVPQRDRRGRVFRLFNADGKPLRDGRGDVGKKMTAIGKAAGVVVDERIKSGKTVRKFASAHDLRRAFGKRLASKLMPDDLRQLMRHEDIQTTMKYYVGQNATALADRLWAAQVGTSVDTTPASEMRGAENHLFSSGDDRS